MSDEVSQEISPGTPFNVAYPLEGDPATDLSPIVRARLEALTYKLRSEVGEDWHWKRHMQLRVGLAASSIGGFYDRASVRQILTSITATFELLRAESRLVAGEWIAEVRRIFAEENLGYRVDSAGGVRFSVDEAFAVQRRASIVALSGDRHKASREKYELGHKALDHIPPDTKTAVSCVFEAVENEFKIITNAPRLTDAFVRERLRPIIEMSDMDLIAKRASLKLVDSLSDWADGCHHYRHAPGTPDPTPPPLELTVLILSAGAGYLRWLAGFPEKGS